MLPHLTYTFCSFLLYDFITTCGTHDKYEGELMFVFFIGLLHLRCLQLCAVGLPRFPNMDLFYSYESYNTMIYPLLFTLPCFRNRRMLIYTWDRHQVAHIWIENSKYVGHKLFTEPFWDDEKALIHKSVFFGSITCKGAIIYFCFFFWRSNYPL